MVADAVGAASFGDTTLEPLEIEHAVCVGIA